MGQKDLAQQYADEPWGKLAIEAGFEPLNTESAARRAFEFAAQQIAELKAKIETLEANEPKMISQSIFEYPGQVFVGFDETGMAFCASNFQAEVERKLTEYAKTL